MFSWDEKLGPLYYGEPVECSLVILSNGHSHIKGKIVCSLCCRKDKLKTRCDVKQCRAWGSKEGHHFHVTCARQAGLGVAVEGQTRALTCFQHKKFEHSLKARIQELIGIENTRSGAQLERIDKPMPMFHASRMFRTSMDIIKCLGWAWRWAEWWVEFGEEDDPAMVSTTPESRCEDARRCRLAAFGAALRNRSYDTEIGDDRVALDRALRAILNTQSLVGVLERKEIELCAEWLARTYRSNHSLLGLGEHAIPVGDEGRALHLDDKSPKYELGERPLPGRQPPSNGEVFEP
eukprot:CAMPEP_0118676366 /NCGR_PEP_ID=MMETSP0800-20121206/2008_1 /TAXON_ID=210618 ORGANISM="Striatella unipunctata, Strain CCMP2910" /NCGR_SAMPLE_ID=MMETSP0800 /ASSEMBLY_ACC=CAM_ASM_000638 /LENGTH=291 /DNA_ID=CAMNT_0006571873 /DNA_START=1 /DNA_END=872 /DNA_ORIENTATION=-